GQLCVNLNAGSGLQLGKRNFEPGHERNEAAQFIRHRTQHHNGDRERCEVLLVRQILVHGHEGVEVSCSKGKQCSVLGTPPAHFHNGLDVVA
ncbi:MAG TPA: hypothetical protein VIM34_03805, partial [Burkholderiaceae bacterium]